MWRKTQPSFKTCTSLIFTTQRVTSLAITSYFNTASKDNSCCLPAFVAQGSVSLSLMVGPALKVPICNTSYKTTNPLLRKEKVAFELGNENERACLGGSEINNTIMTHPGISPLHNKAKLTVSLGNDFRRTVQCLRDLNPSLMTTLLPLAKNSDTNSRGVN